MDTLIKACASSASYILTGTGAIWQNEEQETASLASIYPNGFSQSTHFPHSKGGSVGPITNYKPYNNCSSSSSSSSIVTQRVIGEKSDVATKCENEKGESCHLHRISPTSETTSPVECVPTSTSTTTCPSLPPRLGKGRWIRPLGYAERFMTTASQWGNMTTVYALWLDSDGVITYDSIKQTSQYMFRKMPHLRLSIGKHKNDRWWREMDGDRLDIEEIRTNDVTGTFQSLIKRRYNLKEGPLWFVRFVTPSSVDGLVRDNNFNLKRKYMCIFGFHHNVSDGTTNMNFCNIFLKLLNDVILGKPLDLREEGRFAYPLHDELANAVSTNWSNVQLFLSRVYKGLIVYCEYVRNFISLYPMPTNHEGCTQVLYHELDEVTTSRLLKRCKMENVTLNSVFTAAANIGMYRMILQRDGSVEKTNFDNQQAVSMRRYWPKDKVKNSYGCHISMLDISVPTDISDLDNFWEYARFTHKILMHDFNDTKRALKIQPMCEKLWLAVFVNSWMSWLRLPSANDSHFCITNMGDISSTFSGEGEEVKVSRILRSVSCHFMQTLCQHTLQTFRGKFYYSLDYYPQKMSVDTARAYASILMDTLRSVIHMPN